MSQYQYHQYLPIPISQYGIGIVTFLPTPSAIFIPNSTEISVFFFINTAVRYDLLDKFHSKHSACFKFLSFRRACMLLYVKKSQRTSPQANRNEKLVPNVSFPYEFMNNHMDMKKVCTQWVPKLLTPIQRTNHLDCCQKLLQQSEVNPAN